MKEHTMIPQTLHYIWLGNKELPQTARAFIESWARACPGWRIRRWGLDDLRDMNIPFVQEAVSVRKWAFASDWLRLYALAQEGGFYLDTDVELKCSLESIRDNDMCMGLEDSGYPQTALIGAIPDHPLIKELLSFYSSRRFILQDGVYNEVTNNVEFARLFARHGVDVTALPKDREIEVMSRVRFYPVSLLCHPVGDLPNMATHHETGTWLEPYQRKHLVDMPFGFRVIRMKKRKFATAASPLNLLPSEKLVFSLSLGRRVWAFARCSETHSDLS